SVDAYEKMIFHTRYRLTPVDLEARNSAVAHRLTELTANFTSACRASVWSPERSVTEARAVIG
ncbi:Hha/YmoA family nucleoid-associated regulatory protein, partial [Escherichia coli]|nr:Hha/YmoA family nucleoid-associated regulatory protein [Escherichia coli]